MKISKEMLDQLTKDLTDQGKLIEAGWVGLRHVAVPVDAGKEQLDDMKVAFFAGAMHVFSSMMTVLDPGTEPTNDDLRRLSQIHEELAEFEKELRLRAMPAEGSA